MIKRIKNLFLFSILFMCIFEACENKKSDKISELFPKSYLLSQKKHCNISDDTLAVVEGLVCAGENLVVYDYHSGNGYTLFDEESGEFIARFGAIGQGPAEISLGCYGYLSKKNFYVFDDQTRTIIKYSLDSLRHGKVNGSPVCLAKSDIPDGRISRLIAINDSLFMCAGVYKSRYQFFIFNSKDQVLDYGVDIYNAADSTFNVHTKFLSNQGDLVKHPEKNKFAYTVNFSTNIDFVEIVNDKIELIKSLRLGNPILESVTNTIAGGGVSCSADLSENTQIGYINICATDEFVYALYSDKMAFESQRKSNVVLVFDWNGNPVKKYMLDADAYYITADEKQRSLFAAVKNSDGGWSVRCYSL